MLRISLSLSPQAKAVRLRAILVSLLMRLQSAPLVRLVFGSQMLQLLAM